MKAKLCGFAVNAAAQQRFSEGTRSQRRLACAAALLTLTSTAVYAQETETLKLEEVVVTGSRLQVSGGFNAPTPVTVVSAETIQQRAPANIADVLNEQPAFRVSQSDTTRNAGGLPQQAQNTLDLRALGSSRTLVLINGHRAVGTNWTGTVDTNIVPVGLVERIETVTGGASAAYGSDAVAGVTNIILRNKMQGITANVQTGMTEYGSAKQYTMSLAGGTSFASDRGNIVGGVDYNKSDPIKNVYGTKWGKAEIANITPSTAQRNALGLPQTVIATNVEPGTSAPGGLLYQGTANNLAWTFDANGNPVPFAQGTLWGASQFMTGSTANYGYNTGNVNYLRLPSSRLDAYVRGSFDFTDNITGYIEANNSNNSIGPWQQNYSIVGTNSSGTTPALTISRTNPFVTPAILALLANPNATTFTIGRINTEWGGGFVKQEIDSHRIVTGLQGSFGVSWKWDVYGQFGRTTLDLTKNDPIYFALQKAVNGCNTSVGFSAQGLLDVAKYESLTGKTCVPFNPFGVGRTTNANDYINNASRQLEHIEQDVVSASLSGAPFSLPAGDLAIAFGAEYRREHIVADSDPVSQLGTIATANLVEFTGGYEVKEAFAELGVPLLKDLPAVKSLDLNLAGRRTDYQLSGLVSTWKAGMTWEPLDSVRVRFTRSRDIRAPNYFELFLVGGNATGNVINTIPVGVVGRNGTVNTGGDGISHGVIVVGSGGGRGLVPEVANTTTAGIVFQQGGFNASLDYYQIELNGAIGNLPNINNNNAEVELCRAGDASHCQNVIFDSSAGGIQLVENKMYNVSRQTINGYDFEVGYRQPMLGGNISMRGLINYAPKNQTYNPLVVTATGPGQITESSNTLNAQPKLGYNISIGYDRDRYDFNVQVRGFTARRGNNIVYNSDGSLNSGTVLGPDSPNYNPSTTATNPSINKNQWPGQYTVNPSINVKVNDNVSVYANIDNLFDVGPPALSTSNVYDLIGRRYRVGVRAKL